MQKECPANGLQKYHQKLHNAMAISQKLEAQIRRGESLLPLALGKSRTVSTTEGDIIITKSENGLSIAPVKATEPDNQSVPWQFGRVEVINRPDRTDRKLALQTHLREIAWPFLDPEWHRATPGNQLTPHPDWKSTKNIWAGNQSHLAIIKRAYEDGLESVLIMEDDCLYLPDFLRRVTVFLNQVPKDWGMLYLGGVFTDFRARTNWCGQKEAIPQLGGGVVPPPRKEPIGNGVFRVTGLNNIESYAVHRRFMPEAISILERTLFHSDVALNLAQWGAKTYHMLPPLAQQRAGWSNNFSAYLSDKNARMSTSKGTGAVILSTGAKRRKLLANSTASFRRNNPALGLHIFSDGLFEGYEGTKIKGPSTGFNSRAYKTNLITNSPFSTGVILDDDTLTLKPIPSIDRILGDCSLSLTPDRFSSIGRLLKSENKEAMAWLSRAEADFTLSKYPDCDSAIHYNTGVIFYHQTKETKEFTRVWHEEWKRFGRIDQIAFFRAQRRTGIKINTLSKQLHWIVEHNYADDPIIAHLIGQKDNIEKWMSDNNIPAVRLPAQLKESCCQGSGFVQMAINAANAVGRSITGALSGDLLVDKSKRKERLAACNSCDHLKGRQCELCTCFVSLKTKLSQESCPAGRWQ